mmetsp:Transcript_137567/g.343276  ORF Transcript_137567/g.343276 Transcript_137567/m.343276 type:complete len:222 (-) Transcript_137567:839-1504(-)
MPTSRSSWLQLLLVISLQPIMLACSLIAASWARWLRREQRQWQLGRRPSTRSSVLLATALPPTPTPAASMAAPAPGMSSPELARLQGHVGCCHPRAGQRAGHMDSALGCLWTHLPPSSRIWYASCTLRRTDLADWVLISFTGSSSWRTTSTSRAWRPSAEGRSTSAWASTTCCRCSGPRPGTGRWRKPCRMLASTTSWRTTTSVRSCGSARLWIPSSCVSS